MFLGFFETCLPIAELTVWRVRSDGIIDREGMEDMRSKVQERSARSLALEKGRDHG